MFRTKLNKPRQDVKKSNKDDKTLFASVKRDQKRVYMAFTLSKKAFIASDATAYKIKSVSRATG